MKLHVVRQVRITVLDADSGPIDPTLESMKLLLDAAESLGINPVGEPLVSDEHHMVEVYLSDTNLVSPNDAKVSPWGIKPSFERGRVNLHTAEEPSWRAARRYPDGQVTYLDEVTGRATKVLTPRSAQTFIAEGDES